MENSEIRFHYGDLIESPASGKRYLVRAVAPGVCVVVAPEQFPLDQPAPDAELLIFRQHLLHRFHLVPRPAPADVDAILYREAVALDSNRAILAVMGARGAGE